MKLIKISCQSCGANLEVDPSKKEKIKCSFCGSSFLLDDDVSTVKHIMAGQISDEQEFINAETNLNKFKDYKESYNLYYSLSKRYVDNEEIWIGLLRSYTHDFTLINKDPYFVNNCENYWNKYSALANSKDIKKYEEQYNDYIYTIKTKNIFEILFCYTSTKKLKNKSNNGFTPSNFEMFILTLFAGFFGAHYFAKNRIGMGLLYLFTGGLFLIGWIYDVILAAKKIF